MERITKDLYIGGVTTREAVKYNKIKTVINLLGDTLPYRSIKMPIKDGRANDPKQFLKIMRAIDTAIKQRRTPVFINCAAGMSRSPVVCALYLYWSGKGRYASFDDAIEAVRSKSTVAMPNYKLIEFVKAKVLLMMPMQFKESK